MFNEGSGIRKFLDGELFEEIRRLEGATGGEARYEIETVLVDDGSTDKTIERVRSTELFREREKKGLVRLVVFSKNFGKEVALAAGIRYATGEAVVMIDADGQHPAEAISEMIKRWEKGAKVVTAVRKHNRTKHRVGSWMFYKMMKMAGNKEIVEGAMDFRLIDREVAEEYNKFTEHNRITRGLINWLGYPQEFIKVEIKGREAGRGTYDFPKLMRLAGDSFVSMSRTPLVFFGVLGLIITSFSLLLGLFILIQQYILRDPLGLDWSGAVAMSVFISFLVGLVMISQSITALYISQIHIEAKNRPLYVVDREKSEGIYEKGR